MKIYTWILSCVNKEIHTEFKVKTSVRDKNKKQKQ